MKVCQVIAYAGGAALIGLGAAMAVTNPGRTAYEEFATEQLSAYVQENFCTKVKIFPCTKLVESAQPEMQKFIAENTDRMNFGIFSIYKTELSVADFLPSVADFLPSYEFETVAVWDNFYIYKAEEK